MRALLLLSLSACGPSAPSDSDAPSDDTQTGTSDSGGGDTDAPCENAVRFVHPSSGAMAVDYRTTVEATFDEPDPNAVIAVSGVAGTQAWRGHTLVFTPTTPLEPMRSYEATASFECGAPTWTFQTSEVGTPTTVALAGRTWRLSLDTARVVHPAGIGEILLGLSETTTLVGVEHVTDGDLYLLGAPAVPGSDPAEQDVCVPTTSLPPADFADNPYFESGPAPASFVGSLVFEDLVLSSSVSPDANGLSGAVVRGTVDTRPLAERLDATCTSASPDDDGDGVPDCQLAVCELAAASGTSCRPCVDGLGYCLTLRADSITAGVLDTALVPVVSQESACADPRCATHPACTP